MEWGPAAEVPPGLLPGSARVKPASQSRKALRQYGKHVYNRVHPVRPWRRRNPLHQRGGRKTDKFQIPNSKFETSSVSSAVKFGSAEVQPRGSGLSSGLRVRLVIDLNQFLHRNVRINLCARETRVPQKFLNVAQVGAAVE